MLASNNKRKKMNFTCLVNEKGRIEIVGGFVNRRKGGGGRSTARKLHDDGTQQRQNVLRIG